MFKLSQNGPTRGDCTASYFVDLDKEYTVSEFIKTVLTRNDEWGYIKIHQRPPVSYFDYPKCEYRYGKLLSKLPDKYMDKTIKLVEGDGGWSAMDYVLYL